MTDNITVVVEDPFTGQVTVQEEGTFTTSTSLNNPTYVANLGDVGDVDTSTNGKVDGSVLVYKQSSNKWTSTTLLNQQIMDAGEF